MKLQRSEIRKYRDLFAKEPELCRLGIDMGVARAPFGELTDEQKKRLKAEVTDKL